MKLSAKISSQHSATIGCSQPCNSLVLDLANPFSCKIEFFTNIFQAHRVIHTNTEEKADYFFLSFG
jgi:hypothetical protein